jgi:hypothetical protein
MNQNQLEITTPPCAPSHPDDAEFPNLIRPNRDWYALTESREGDAWGAIAAAASVGAYPERVISKRDADGEAVTRHVTDLGRFAAGFDRLLTRNNLMGISTIVTLSGAFHRDDCAAGDVAELMPLAFLAVETSRDSYQVWFRLPDVESDTEARRRFHAMLTAAGIGGNPGGTHSGRWPGSVNGKPNRDGWMVRIAGREDGRVTTLNEVESTLSPTLPAQNSTRVNSARLRASVSGTRRRLPDYGKCLAGKSSRSEADASFIRIAIDYHFGDDEIMAGLVAVSERFGAMPPAHQQREIERIRGKYA